MKELIILILLGIIATTIIYYAKGKIHKNELTDLKTDMESSVNEAMKYGKSIGIITKNDEEAIKIYDTLKGTLDITLIDSSSRTFSRKLVVIPVYMAKRLEFDSVIIYTDKNNKYTDKEKYLYYVAITRCQHKLIVYNQ